VVDIRDCAKGVVMALTKGKPGHRYILGGDNLTARDLVLGASAETGCAPHLFRFPRGFYSATSRLAVMLAALTGKSKVSYYPDLARLLDYDWAFSSKKARDELGYKSRSIYTSLKDLLNNKFLDTYLKPTKNNNRQ
jgi:nucleoside-diphosphate-sugar epimerase